MPQGVSINIHGHRIEFAGYGETWVKDGDYLYFGDDSDVSMAWVNASSLLKILPAAADTGAINFGDGTTDMDVKIFLGAAADNVAFDVGAKAAIIAGAVRITFRDGTAYPGGIAIWSSVAGMLNLYCSGTAYNAIVIETGSAGGIKLYAYLGLKVTDTDGAAEGQIWMDDSENTIKFYGGAAVLTLADSVHTFTFGGEIIFNNALGIMMSSNYRINFRGDGGYPGDIFINSPGAGKLTIYAPSTAEDAIVINAGPTNTGGIKLYGYLGLAVTDVDGAAEGQIWFDNSENMVKYFGGGAVVTLGAFPSLGGLITTNNKLSFRNDSVYPGGIHVWSAAVGMLNLYCSGTAADAIVIETGANGGVKLYAYLSLKITDVDGATRGQLWYDSSENKLKFYDGTAVRTVTSA